ncbi:MAG: DUF115 domain-containing protein [Eubacterium sp.]|nr:DUF115 domain-containing protein [Eubacterium sp.]
MNGSNTKLDFQGHRFYYSIYKHTTTVSDTIILFYAQGDPKKSNVYQLYLKMSELPEFRNCYLVWIVRTPEEHMDMLSIHHTIVVRENSKQCSKYLAAARYWITDDDCVIPFAPGKKRIYHTLSDASEKTLSDAIALFNQPAHKLSTTELLINYAKKTINRFHIVWLIGRYNIVGFFRSRGIMHNNNSLRLEMLKNSHKGERCFLIGNGPSLNGHDLDLLKDECTFGTNMVYKIFDQTEWRPTFHCVSDSIYASKLGSELSEKVRSPLFTTERTYRRMRRKPVDTTYIHTIQSERYKVKGNIQTYCMVKATVLSLATEMAFHMGFSEIYLLGVDCTNPHDKGGHFTENYATKEVAETDINRIKTRMKTNTLTTQQIGEHIIDRSMEVYALLHEYAQKNGVKIYNATRGGNLEIFPRVTLEDVLQKQD